VSAVELPVGLQRQILVEALAQLDGGPGYQTKALLEVAVLLAGKCQAVRCKCPGLHEAVAVELLLGAAAVLGHTSGMTGVDMGTVLSTTYKIVETEHARIETERAQRSS
jgi:hypothetical protein